MNAVSREQAVLEVEKWLDHKRMSSRKRESNKESIEALTNAIEDGNLVLNPETFELDQQLSFPVGEIKKIVFTPRMPIGTIHNNLSGTKSDDGDARILAYVAALTGQNSGIIRKMDTEDYSISKNIAYFFL